MITSFRAYLRHLQRLCSVGQESGQVSFLDRIRTLLLRIRKLGINNVNRHVIRRAYTLDLAKWTLSKSWRPLEIWFLKDATHWVTLLHCAEIRQMTSVFKSAGGYIPGTTENGRTFICTRGRYMGDLYRKFQVCRLSICFGNSEFSSLNFYALYTRHVVAFPQSPQWTTRGMHGAYISLKQESYCMWSMTNVYSVCGNYSLCTTLFIHEFQSIACKSACRKGTKGRFKIVKIWGMVSVTYGQISASLAWLELCK